MRAFLDDLSDEVAATLALQIDRLNLLSDELSPLAQQSSRKGQASS